jgi:hypothetical protein
MCSCCSDAITPVAIHRLSPMEQDRILSNKYPQIATIPESKVDKIRLTNDQIQQFNNLALQLTSGSITMEEAVLQLRGGDGLTDVVGVIAFVIFANRYDSLFGVEAFLNVPLPHQDPFGWLSGKYDSKMLVMVNVWLIHHLDLNERHFIWRNKCVMRQQMRMVLS